MSVTPVEVEVANQNSEVRSALSSEIAALEAKGEDQELIAEILKYSNKIISTAVFACVDNLEEALEGSSLGRNALGRTLKVVNAAGVTTWQMEITEAWDPTILVKEIVKTLASEGASKLVSHGFRMMSISGGPVTMLVAFAGGELVGKAIDWGYNQYMDKSAIWAIPEDGEVAIKCSSDISSFLEDEWEDVHQSVTGREWAVSKRNDNVELTIQFRSPSEDDTYRVKILNSGFSNLYDYAFDPETTDEKKAILIAFSDKIGADFNLQFNESGTSVKIYNFSFLSSSEFADLINSGGESVKEAIAALNALSPFYEEDSANLGSINVSDFKNKYSDQYVLDKAQACLNRLNNEAYDITFVDITTDTKIGGGDDRKFIFGSEAGETIEGSGYKDHLYGDDGDDTIRGKAGSDYIEGGAGSDKLYGGSGDDTFAIYGNDESSDEYYGDAGIDTIQGDSANNTIKVSGLTWLENSIEIVDGGEGEDSLEGSAASDIFDLTYTRLRGIEKLDFGGGDDILYFDADKIEGPLSEIDGGAGVDTISGEQDGFWGNPNMDINLSELTISGIEKILGGDDNDSIVLNRATITGELNELDGGEGNDTISLVDVQANGAIIGNIKGGDGDNTYDLTGLATTSIDNIEGGVNDDTLTLSRAAVQNINAISLEDGNNTIIADDISNIQFGDILGGADKDNFTFSNGTKLQFGLISLGDNDNTIRFNNINGLTLAKVNLGGNSSGFNDSSKITISDSVITSINTLQGGTGNNTFTISNSQLGTIGRIGGAQEKDDVIFDNVTIDSHINIDLMDGENSFQFKSVTINAAGQYTGGVDNDSFDLSSSTVNADIVLSGGNGDNNFSLGGVQGSASQIKIQGGNESDTLDGSEIKDVFYGGGGSDNANGNGGEDELNGGAGADTLSGGAGDDTLNGGAGDDTLNGGAGDDTLVGGADSDTLNGGADNDTLTGDGNDTLNGGSGDDTYHASSGDVISDSDGSGTVHFGGTLSGGEQEEEGSSTYKGGGKTYKWSGGALKVSGGGGSITIKSFSNGDLGIDLKPFDEPDPPPPEDLPVSRDPLALDLGDNGIITTGLEAGIHFDHDGDGFRELSGFISSEDGLLVRDINGDGKINDGRELFGDSTRLLDGSLAVHGFAALSELDDQKDGVIDKNDAAFSELKIFQDFNQNGFADEGELFSLDEKNIKALNVQYEDTAIVDKYGNVHRQTGSYVTESGNNRTMTDVDFVVNMKYTTSDMLEVPEDIQALPDAVGYGTAHSLRQTMVRDETGRLQELVTQYVAATDRQTRLKLSENILYVWAGQEENSGNKKATMVTFFGQVPSGSWAALPNRFEQFQDSLLYQLNKQTHLKKLFDNITYTHNQEADTWVGRYDNVVPVLARMLDAKTQNNIELLEEFVQSVNGLNPYNNLNTRALQTEIDHYLSLAEHDTVHSETTFNLLKSVTLGASAQADNIYGSEFDDTLYGFSGNDTIFGGEGNDVLEGGRGDDSLEGGAGNDIYRFAEGFGKDRINNLDTSENRIDIIEFTDATREENLIFSRRGEDLIITLTNSDDEICIDSHFYQDSTGGYAVNLIRFSDGSTKDIGASAFSTLNQIVNTITTENDTVHGSLISDTIDGLEGDDVLYGKGGNDFLDGSEGDDTLYGDEGADVLRGGAGRDKLMGGGGNDELYGNDDTDIIKGGAGNDLIVGGLGGDILTGGLGDDTFRYSLGDGNDLIDNKNSSASTNDLLELININEADVTLTRLSNDLLFQISDGGSIRVANFFLDEIGTFGAVKFDDGSVWSHSDIQSMTRIGTAGNDNLYGTSSDNVIHGLAGNDKLVGFSGDDQLHGDEGNDKLYGGTGNDGLMGGAGVDYLYGEDGDDTLTGGAGVDTLIGGKGDDTYVYETGFGQDVINNSGKNNGFDVISFGATIDKEQIVVRRSANNLILDIESTGDSITVLSYFYEIESDSYNIVDEIRFHDGSVWDSDIIKALSTHITNQSDVIYGYSEDNTFDGLAGDDDIHGGGGNDHLTGNVGHDALFGGSGNDHLFGGAGNDSIYGGEGNDTISGGDGNDVFSGGLGNDTYLFEAGFGHDRITTSKGSETIQFGNGITASQFEVKRYAQTLYLTSTTSDDSLRIDDYFNHGSVKEVGSPFQFSFSDGSALSFENIVDQSLLAVTDEADYLFGYEEDNVISSAGGNDRIYSNGGSDTIDGGAGDDYIDAGTGNDLVQGGVGSDSLYGQSGDDNLKGGAGNDSLRGGRGNDVLEGGAGNDYLTGEGGNDIYKYSAGFGADTIDNRYNVNTDAFDIIEFDDTVGVSDITVKRSGNNLVLQSTSSDDSITVRNFFYSYARGNYIINEVHFADGTVWDIPAIKEMALVATENDDTLYGYEQGDVIDGLAGNDKLYGDIGNDQLTGGVGDDYLNGGLGDDIYHYSAGFGKDVIDNRYDVATNSFDKISFDSTISVDDIRVIRSGENLVLRVDATGDQITVNKYFHNQARGNYIVNEIHFADGTVWDIPTVKSFALATTENADTIFGYDSDDVISGLAGNDKLYGDAGADQLIGGSGDDYLSGDAGNDILIGGTGDDTLYGGNGNDIYRFALGDGHDIVQNYDTQGGVDVVEFQEGISASDIVVRNINNDLVMTIGDGTDKITVKRCFSSDGNSAYAIDAVIFADGTELNLASLKAMATQGSASDDSITGFSTDDVMSGGLGDDYLSGLNGNDTMSGDEGNDKLYGGYGNDVIQGGAGDDILDGGANDDILQGGLGNDHLKGGEGSDIYRFAVGDGQDTINNYEYTQTLNYIELYGIMSFDEIQLRRVGNDLVINVGDQGDSITVQKCFYNEGVSRYAVAGVRIGSGGAPLSMTDLKYLATQGSQYNDTLVAFEGNDVIRGFTGNDYLWGKGGDDLAYGGTGDDFIDGGSGNDILHGNEGVDTIIAREGDDVIHGGTGNDNLTGGAGSDTYYFALGDGVDTVNNYDTSASTDTIEFATGITPADIRYRRVDNNLVIFVGTGSDQITVTSCFNNDGDTPYAIDQVRFADGTLLTLDQIKVQAVLGVELDDALVGFETVDLVQGAGGNDTIEARGGNDIIDGGSGDDSLDAGSGDDQITGGIGNDTLTGGAGSDTYHFGLGDGIDTVNNIDTSESTDVIEFATGIAPADIKYRRVDNNLVLTIGDVGDQITVTNCFLSEGNSPYAIDLVRFADGTTLNLAEIKVQAVLGSDLNDTLVGFEGKDLVQGGGGDDTINSAGGDDIVHAGSGVDTIYGGAGNDQIFGEDGADNIYGGDGLDELQGGAGQDIIHGDLASDTIKGGLDNDTLYGDQGDDIIHGEDGNDTIYGGDQNDTLYGNSGSDTISGGAHNDTLYGGLHTDSLLGGSGNDRLFGEDGGDTLSGNDGDDYLNGGSGADIMDGGTGDDIYIVDQTGDVVTELLGEGYDTVESDLDITLVENVEKAVLTGIASTNATGNELANDLFGNSANNILDGGIGADNMSGMLGDDTYHTDNLGDRIHEANDEGADHEIRHHESQYLLASNVENLTLADSVFRGNGNELDNIIIGNDSENNLWGREGNDTLYGMGGNDTLIGDVGQDHIDGGSGDDLLSGGDANDTLLGGSGNDQLDGGAGVNSLRGGVGDDKYVYRADGGVYEIDNSDGGQDWLLFTDDITIDRLAFVKSGDDLIVRVDGDENRQVTVASWFLGSEYQLYAVQPSGGNGITAATINNMFPPEGAETDTIEVPADSAFDARRHGTLGDDSQLQGTSDNDLIRGYQGADNIFAFAGDDWLLGGTGDDYLDGGTGNDMLHAGDGNDRYVFKAGYGEDTIDNSGGGTDWLLFTDNLSQDNLVFTHEGDDLVILVQDTTDKVTIKNWFLGDEYKIDYIQPSGGYGLSTSQVEALVVVDPSSGFDSIIDGTTAGEQLVGTAGSNQINGLDGADQLFGLGGNDELNGGIGNDYLDGGEGDDVQNGDGGNDQLGGDAGNDTLVGGAGDDTYVYRPGAGADIIDNLGGGTDSLLFTDGITSDRITYLQVEDNLVVRIDGDEATQVTVKDWFKGAEYQLSFIQPAGGNGVPASQINDLFTTTPPPTGDPLEVPAESSFDLVRSGTTAGEQVVGSNGNDLLKGLAGDDQLFAFDGNDWLLGGDGNDYFDGGAGNDTMIGGAGNDQLGGDAGNDIMAAGAGDDKYVYRPGSGADTIINSGGGTDWLLFTGDITADRLSYFKSGDDLFVKVDSSNDTMVTIKDWFKGGENQVSYIQPSGAYGISAAQINTMVQDEPAAAPMMSDSTLGDMAASMASTGSDVDVYSRNAGVYLGGTNSLGISDDLSSLSNNPDQVNRELLAA